jgi:predicted transposase/invertase (TIGR01784 family)
MVKQKEEPEIIKQPHDKLFKQVFSEASNAVDFIRGIFPKELLSKLKLETIVLENSSYITKNLKESFSDLVYSVEYDNKKTIQISLLFEHKSYPEKYPHIQLLEYQVNVFKAQLKQKKVLTPIIPIIVYHGKSSWKYREFSEYFDGIDDELKKYLPEFKYLLCDFNKLELEEITGKLFNEETIKVTVALMKLIFNNKTLEESLYKILSIGSNRYDDKGKGEAFLETIILYLLYASDIEPEVITETISKISEKGENKIMSTATKLMERGESIGLQRGRQEGRKEGRKEGESIGLRKAYERMLKTGMKSEEAKSILGMES